MQMLNAKQEMSSFVYISECIILSSLYNKLIHTA